MRVTEEFVRTQDLETAVEGVGRIQSARREEEPGYDDEHCGHDPRHKIQDGSIQQEKPPK